MNRWKRWSLATLFVLLAGCRAAPASSVVCNFAGSPYLDPDIPDVCESGQPPPP